MSTRPPLLRLEHISLSFKAVKAVVDIGFDVRRHEICALVGPNGAGKSSLLNVISGLYRPQEGTITFDGETQRHMDPRRAAQRGIARTFQNIAVFKGMSVLDNVLTGRSLAVRSTWLEQTFRVGRAPRQDIVQRERAEHVIEFLRIQQHRHANVGQLPYGPAEARGARPERLAAAQAAAAPRRSRWRWHAGATRRRE